VVFDLAVVTDLAVATPAVTRPASPAEDDPLLASKFAVPELPRFMVSRPRLHQRLSHGVQEPLTLVTGPAGSGKTQLVASWVATGSVADEMVWITLEEGDGRPSVFWTYVVEGLRRAGLPLSPHLIQPMPIMAVDRSFLVRLAAELSNQPRSVVLVLDGVSSLSNRQWATDLDFVLRHAGQRLRLILVGRWDPPLPLHRYRLAGRLTEVRSEDLAFTAAESAELLALHDVSLSATALASLLQHTEGWAAGLRLSAMALQGRGEAESLVATIGGDEATIAEYFVGEVLRAQPSEVRDFLLKTSILDAFTPELAEALTGRSDARRILAALERENAFVQRVDERSRTYRYHRLFAELLRAQLACDEPEQILQLHHRAAGWFAGQGHIVEAIAHAAMAHDWAAAAAITIEEYAVGQLLLGGEADRLGASLSNLPDDVNNAESVMVAAALALADADLDRCARLLTRVEKLIVDGTWDYGNALALAGVVLETLLASAYRDAPRVLHAAQVAESLIARAPADRLEEHPELRVLVLTAKGTAQSWVGAIDAAAVTLTEAAMAATAAGCEYPRMDCLQQLALIEAYRGRLRHAGAPANQAIELADRCGWAHERRPVAAEVALAWVAMERYDVEAAWRHLRAAEPMCGPGADGLATAGFAVVKSRLLRARGELRGALLALQDAGTALGGKAGPAWLAREIVLSRARLLIASGRPDEALATVRGLGEPGSPDVAVVLAAALLASGDPERARQVATPVTEAPGAAVPASVDAWLVLATLAADSGDAGRAREALRQALRCAAPESQRRTFHEVGARLRRLLRDDEELAQEYRALAGSAARAGRSRPADVQDEHAELVIVDALSKREMEVLRQMAAMLPTEEIAASLYVSVNTVKTHVRSILRKLSASRRNEAVRRARSLGLI
jgi:LuxR family maltose regulon positive regulatory protein